MKRLVLPLICVLMLLGQAPRPGPIVGGGGGGSGTVSSGTSGQLAYYATTGSSVSGTTAIPNGTTATTQSAADNSTKVATTAYVDAAAAVPSARAFATLTDSATVAWAVSGCGDNRVLTLNHLTATRTVSISGMTSGCIYGLAHVQDSTGAATSSPGTCGSGGTWVVLNSGGTNVWASSTAANAYDFMTIQYDGLNNKCIVSYANN